MMLLEQLEEDLFCFIYAWEQCDIDYPPICPLCNGYHSKEYRPLSDELIQEVFDKCLERQISVFPYLAEDKGRMYWDQMGCIEGWRNKRQW